MREHSYCVYILASAARMLYIGVTNDAMHRTWQHKEKLIEGFTSKFIEHRLVYFETYQYVQDAIAREKQLKRWRREKKEWLIESVNPNWHDLSDGWYAKPNAKALSLDSPQRAGLARDDKGREVGVVGHATTTAKTNS